MENTKEMLAELSKKLENESFLKNISKINEQIKDTETMHVTKNEAIKDSIAQVKRKNKQMETEVERLSILQEKNATNFSKKNNERIKFSRKIVELEEENESLEARMHEIEAKIASIEDKIKVLSYPTQDELYYEVVKGFGVSFVEKDGKVVANVKNRSKNDVFSLDCSGNPVEVSEEIWKCIE